MSTVLHLQTPAYPLTYLTVLSPVCLPLGWEWDARYSVHAFRVLMEVFHFKFEVWDGVERNGQSFSDGHSEEPLVYPLEHYCIWCLNHSPWLR
jgi:hypothetical protein